MATGASGAREFGKTRRDGKACENEVAPAGRDERKVQGKSV